MSRHVIALCLVFAAAVIGCSSSSQPQPESMLAEGANFASYQTFSWYPMPAIEGNNQPLRLLDQNIRDGVRNEMRRRGYTEDSNNPDLLIAYETATENKMENNPVRVGVGVGGYSSGFGGSINMSSPSVRNYQEGTLVIHAVDARTNAEVWQGSLSGEVRNKGDLQPAAVRNAVSVAMRDFPPRSAP
jgi:hypothetical protein